MEELQLIMRNAIKEEEYFCNFYKKLAEMAENVSIKEEMMRLSEQEGMHKEKLESINFDEGSFIPEKISELDVKEEVELTPLEEFRDIRHMLSFAVKQEIIARTTYEKLAEAAKNEMEKELLFMLAKEEKKHELLLTGKLALLNTQGDAGKW